MAWQNKQGEIEEKEIINPIKALFMAVVAAVVLIFFAKEGVISPLWLVGALAALAIMVSLLLSSWRRQQAKINQLTNQGRALGMRKTIGYCLMVSETVASIALILVGFPVIPALLIGTILSFLTFHVLAA